MDNEIKLYLQNEILMFSLSCYANLYPFITSYYRPSDPNFYYL